VTLAEVLTAEIVGREIRVGTDGIPVVTLPGFKGDLYYSQINTEGTIIKGFPHDIPTVRAISPETPLFKLEEHPEIEVVGDGMYNKRYAFGADERFQTEGFRLDVLEALLTAFQSRSIELRDKAEIKIEGTDKPLKVGKSLRQFYPYAMYYHNNPYIGNSSLVGRLLASRVVAPQIDQEIKASARYFEFSLKERCKYCDKAKEEERKFLNPEQGISPSEHRVVLAENDQHNNGCVAYVPYSLHDQHHIRIIPFKHIARHTDLSSRQIQYLASAIYKSLQMIIKDADRTMEDGSRLRDLKTVEIVLHSAPFYNNAELERVLLSHNGHENGGNRRSNGNLKLEDFYHFHADIFPGTIPAKGDSLEIPGSRLLVVPIRPIYAAQKLREALNHQP